MNEVDLPAEPGTYALLFDRPHPGPLQIGKLGRFEFPTGFYLYVGSALGSGGLSGRLGRHLSPNKRIHWHIDYLDQQAGLVEIWYGVGKERREHNWATAASLMPGGQLLAPGFGASDCSCESHLIHFLTRPLHQDFAKALTSSGPGEPPIRQILKDDLHAIET